MEPTNLPALRVCHSVLVKLAVRPSKKARVTEPSPEDWLGICESREDINSEATEASCGSPYPSLSSLLRDLEVVDLLVANAVRALQTSWQEVPLELESLEEDKIGTSPPLRIIALEAPCDDRKKAELLLELRVIADPLALAQRARLAIYPPWQLGPNVRFSWRLEPRVQAYATPTASSTARESRSAQPRARTGIGGVGGGFGGGVGSSFDIACAFDAEQDSKVPLVSTPPFRLLSNEMDPEANEPTGFLLPLYTHQRQSLAWMQACERPHREPLLLGASREFLPALHPPHASQQILAEAVACRALARVQRAYHVRGGLLADHVGSGKTAVTLALVAADLTGGAAVESVRIVQRTLVLVPGRLLQQWHLEAKKFLTPGLVDVRVLSGLLSLQDSGAGAQLLLAPLELLDSAGPDSSGKRRRLEVVGSSAELLQSLSELRLRRIVVDEFHELLDQKRSSRLAALQELRSSCDSTLWGLSGTPQLADFAAVARLAESLGVDLQVFRRQIDARELAQKAVDYLARSNGSAQVSGLEVQEELASLHHTPAERAIYVQAANDARRKRRQRQACKDTAADATSDPPGAELLQLCSHFRLEGMDADGTAETESASLLRQRADAVETAREWLLLAARRMEEHVLGEQQLGSLNEVVAEQYALLLVEVGGKPWSHKDTGFQAQMAGAKAAQQGAAGRRRHERDADELILKALVSVREAASASCMALSDSRSHELPTGGLELLEEVRQAKESFRQRRHEHVFLAAMLEAAEAENFQCPVCLGDPAPTERAMLSACAHLFCLRCALTLVRSAGECALCRQSLRRGFDSTGHAPREEVDGLADGEILRVREPGAVQEEEREDRQRWGRFGSKLFHVVRKLRDIERQDPTARAIVFVQWTSLRRKLAAAFAEFQVPYVCLEERFEVGQAVENNVWERDDVVTSFQGAPPDSTEGPKVLLLSLQDAASGTNLTRASHVLFVHPMSAESQRLAVAYETQALGRCLRLGQTKPVCLWRFVTLGTVEEDLSYRHQQELWSRRPELLAERMEAKAVQSIQTEPKENDEDEDVDLDDLFW